MTTGGPKKKAKRSIFFFALLTVRGLQENDHTGFHAMPNGTTGIFSLEKHCSNATVSTTKVKGGKSSGLGSTGHYPGWLTVKSVPLPDDQLSFATSCLDKKQDARLT
jgi:hypothetical protein